MSGQILMHAPYDDTDTNANSTTDVSAIPESMPTYLEFYGTLRLHVNNDTNIVRIIILSGQVIGATIYQWSERYMIGGQDDTTLEHEGDGDEGEHNEEGGDGDEQDGEGEGDDDEDKKNDVNIYNINKKTINFHSNTTFVFVTDRVIS